MQKGGGRLGGLPLVEGCCRFRFGAVRGEGAGLGGRPPWLPARVPVCGP